MSIFSKFDLTLRKTSPTTSRSWSKPAFCITPARASTAARCGSASPPRDKEVHDTVAGLYDKHVATVEQIGGITCEEFAKLNQALARLERF